MERRDFLIYTSAGVAAFAGLGRELFAQGRGNATPIDWTADPGKPGNFPAAKLARISMMTLNFTPILKLPVNPPAPFEFDLPKGAIGATIMEGSSPNAAAAGSHISVQGPFPPGHTYVQAAYQMPAATGSLTIAQRFPVMLEQLAVVVKKSGSTTLSSAQIKEQRELPAQGEVFIAATGGAIAAGQPLELEVGGIAHHSRAPRIIALALAGIIVAVGVWMAGRPSGDASGSATERKRLIARREKLFNELARLEQDRRGGRADDRRYAARREELIASLEQIYGALESHDTGPEPAGRAGVAA